MHQAVALLSVTAVVAGPVSSTSASIGTDVLSSCNQAQSSRNKQSRRGGSIKEKLAQGLDGCCCIHTRFQAIWHASKLWPMYRAIHLQ
jgi:hypothetical protein